MVKLFLSEPEAKPWRPKADEAPWESDVEWAKKRAEPWAREWLEPAQVAAWLRVWPQAKPELAGAFSRAGISPQVAMTPLWYGKINPGRKPLALRVALNEITFEEAIVQLRSPGLV